MNEFLRSELEQLPEGVAAATLKQLENACRAARAAVYYDSQVKLDERCIAICARIASILEFASVLKSNIHGNRE